MGKGEGEFTGAGVVDTVSRLFSKNDPRCVRKTGYSSFTKIRKKEKNTREMPSQKINAQNKINEVMVNKSCVGFS